MLVSITTQRSLLRYTCKTKVQPSSNHIHGFPNLGVCQCVRPERYVTTYDWLVQNVSQGDGSFDHKPSDDMYHNVLQVPIPLPLTLSSPSQPSPPQDQRSLERRTDQNTRCVLIKIQHRPITMVSMHFTDCNHFRSFFF